MANNLVTPAKLHKKIIQAISKYIECHDPLTFDYFNDNKSKLALRNENGLFHSADDGHFFLCKIKNIKSLYIHLDVTYKIPKVDASLENNTFKFEGVSLQFLHGRGRFFCRADWEVKDQKDKLDHPQPHWHWGEETEEYDDSLNNETFTICEEEDQRGDFYQEIGQRVDNIDDENLPDVNFEALHYAIAAKWAGRDVAKEDFTEAKLVTCIKNTLINIIDQYQYQINKKSFKSCKDW